MTMIRAVAEGSGANEPKQWRPVAVECFGCEANADGGSPHLHRAGCAGAVEHVADGRVVFAPEPLLCPAYEAVASNMPAELGISTSISSVETLSPRSIRT